MIQWMHFLYIHIGKILPDKIYLLNTETFAIQVGKATGIGSKGKGQPIGIERLIGAVKIFIEFAVFAITQQRVACVGKLGTDLVGTAGDQLTFHQGQFIGIGQHHIIGLARF